MLTTVLKFVHLFTMAAWIGSSMFAPADIRRTFAGNGDFAALRERMRSIGRVAMGSGALTFLSGLALIFALGGFGTVTPAIHIGLVTGLVTAIVGGAGIGRTWGEIDKKLAANADPASLAPLVRRIGILSHVFHLLWLVTLVLMVFRGYF